MSPSARCFDANFVRWDGRYEFIQESARSWSRRRHGFGFRSRLGAGPQEHHISPVVAGVAAYELAKHTGRPGHKNVLQRHPVLTGLGAAYLAHRHNKKH